MLLGVEFAQSGSIYFFIEGIDFLDKRSLFFVDLLLRLVNKKVFWKRQMVVLNVVSDELPLVRFGFVLRSHYCLLDRESRAAGSLMVPGSALADERALELALAVARADKSDSTAFVLVYLNTALDHRQSRQP